MAKKIELGLFLELSNHAFNFFTSAAQEAEKSGFTTTLVGDHHALPWTNFLFEGLTSLAAIAAKTDTIKIGTCVTPIPFYHPCILAKRVATLDHISKGRMIFGAGCGYYKEEFSAYGIPFNRFNTRIEKMKEGIKIIRLLWTANKPKTFQGKFYRIEKAKILPKPIKRPHPPIWFGGSSTKVLESALEYGQGLIFWQLSPKEIERKLIELTKISIERKKSKPVLTYGVCVRSYVSIDSSRAKSIVGSLTREERDKSFHGTPDECLSQIEEYFSKGVKHIALQMWPPKNTIESVRMYRKEIIPSL